MDKNSLPLNEPKALSTNGHVCWAHSDDIVIVWEGKLYQLSLLFPLRGPCKQKVNSNLTTPGELTSTKDITFMLEQMTEMTVGKS